MASKALKAVAPTVQDALDEIDANRNTRIWDVLSKTDPAHTKGFQRAGGFRGTAIKPMWVVKRLTEIFGPVGIGWGTEEPQFTTVIGQDGEVLVYCTVAGWYEDNGKPARVYGVGGDKAVAWVGRDNNRRMVADDEAFKKAFTDAIGNAFKFVGVAADIHMGLFEDSKYLAEVTAEFHPPREDPKPTAKEKDGDYSPTALRGAIKTLIHNINGCSTVADLDELLELDDAKDVLEQCQRRFPAWWETGEGCPAEFTPLRKLIHQTRAGLIELEPQE